MFVDLPVTEPEVEHDEGAGDRVRGSRVRR